MHCWKFMSYRTKNVQMSSSSFFETWVFTAPVFRTLDNQKLRFSLSLRVVQRWDTALPRQWPEIKTFSDTWPDAAFMQELLLVSGSAAAPGSDTTQSKMTPRWGQDDITLCRMTPRWGQDSMVCVLVWTRRILWLLWLLGLLGRQPSSKNRRTCKTNFSLWLQLP